MIDPFTREVSDRDNVFPGENRLGRHYRFTALGQTEGTRLITLLKAQVEVSGDPMPRKIIVAVSDLFVQSRVLQIAHSQSIDVEVLAPPLNLPKTSEQRLVILDMDSSEYDPYQVARELKTLPGPPILFGFYPHVKADLEHLPEQAGLDHVVINRELVTRLVRLLEEWKNESR